MPEILTEENLTLESAITQIVGYASTCWESMSGTGVFQEDRAIKAVAELLDWIKENQGQVVTEPWLGLATTDQLLVEVGTRMEMVKYAENTSTEKTVAAFNSDLLAQIHKNTPALLLEYRTADSQ